MDTKDRTRSRLLAAASELFAERGFHGTTARDIAARAGVNLASGNYHYGSKKALYLAVLRAQFAEIRTLLAVRGAVKAPDELRRLSRRELETLLRARTRTMLDLLIGPRRSLHGTLMQREMIDPSEALPVIIDEFIRPMVREMEAIVARLAPGSSRRAIERCVYSILGQALFYHFCKPAMLGILGANSYPRAWALQLAEHITAFSSGGINRLAHSRTAARSARPSSSLRRRARHPGR